MFSQHKWKSRKTSAAGKPRDYATVIESLIEGTDTCVSGALHKGELTHLDVVTLGRKKITLLEIRFC